MLSALVRVPAFRLSLFAADWKGASRPRLRRPTGRQWIATAVLAIFLSLYAVAGLNLAARQAPGEAEDRAVAAQVAAGIVPPAPEPLRFQQVAPDKAVQVNAAVPISALPNPSAAPFALGGASPGDRLRSLDCLTQAVYYEAATEPLEGQRAVAQVVLNRVRHPAYPNTVCGVVYQGSQRSTGCQFTFTCDGALRRAPMASYWARARNVAAQALAGYVHAPVGWATHYHTNWVVPYWSSSLVKAAVVGTHIFYRWTGGWGRPPAFRQRYAGLEPDVSELGRRTVAPPPLIMVEAEAIDPAATAAAEQALVDPAAPLPPVPTQADMSKRAVVRRYEPLSREAATAAAITRSGEPASVSHRWALGGGTGTSGPPLGRKADAPEGDQKAGAAAEPPKCLEGVRRRGDAPGSTQTGC
jgi:spore germination cell wall hydrolase CwlJ-like protein